MNYCDMTIWQLEQEKIKINEELSRRLYAMPKDQIEIQHGPHRIRITATSIPEPQR